MNLPRRPLPFVLCASNHGSMIVNHKDFQMVAPDRGYGVGYQLLTAGCFDPEEVNTVLQLLDLRRASFPGQVIALDCGANVGVHTLEWARHMHGWGNVIAIEAQERIFYALAGNIALNNCFNARAVHAALGAEKGQLLIPIPNYNMPSSFGSLELRKGPKNEPIGQPINYQEERCEPVPMLPIDALVSERVDFIKIDVEGMELEVLAGARVTIERCKPQLLIEVIKSDSQSIHRMLTASGYRIFPMGINVLAIHETDPSSSRINVKQSA